MATPIWKDIIVNLGTANEAEYIIYDAATYAGNIIYTGKAYKKPGESNIRIKVNAILQDYLAQSFGAGLSAYDDDMSVGAQLRRPFSVYVGPTRKAELDVYLNWEYIRGNVDETYGWSLHAPVTGRIQAGMKIPFTTMLNATQFPVGSYIETYDYDRSEYAIKRLETEVAGPQNAFILASLASGGLERELRVRVGNLPSSLSPALINVTYWVTRKCHRWALYYVNKMGGWDVLVIEGRWKENESYKRSSYKKTYDNTGDEDRGNVNYRNDITKTWELHTGWLTDAQAGRMQHLLGSNYVFLCDCDDDYHLYPVTIANKDCPSKDHKDGMVSYQIDVELARDMIRR